MKKTIHSLTKLIEEAQEHRGQSELWMAQHEVESTGVTLGDEDTGGAGAELELKALLKTPEQALNYSETFQDPLLYEDAMSQLEQIKKLVPYHVTSPQKLERLTSTW
ncbi:hypothetical protein [Mesobacillus harenae]|uniref:hypothetical protein n=1 Tax=Mesobacillus harenae TaxID=2213203 RepID=UPI0015807A4D|nr:hypothetical protein [Mesobacillus harenae]